MRGTFGIVVAAAMALLVVGILFSLAPTVGGEVEEAGIDTLPPNSSWNETHNTAIQAGGDFFTENQTWVTLLFLGIVAGVVIMMFMRW